MKRLISLLGALVLWPGCGMQGELVGPPNDRLFYPTGLAHLQVPGSTNGVLLVANANGNKRYGAGSVVALELDKLGLPELGAPPEPVRKVTELHDPAQVLVGSFMGELHLAEVVAGQEWRVYTASRAEFNRVFRVKLSLDGTTPRLECLGGGDGNNCVDTGVSLTQGFERTESGVPRAPQPFGVTSSPRTCAEAVDCETNGALNGRTCEAGVCRAQDGAVFSDVFVTHIAQADSPTASNLLFRSYLVRLDSDVFAASEQSFIPLGGGATNSAVALGNWVYVSGRLVSPAPNLLRIIKRDGSVVSSSLGEAAVRVSDSRAVALSSDRSRLYLVGRMPDTLLIADILGADSDAPSVRFTREVPMIDAATDAQVIARPGRGDLVAISGASISAGAVAIYDTDLGETAAVVRGTSQQPSSLAVDVRGTQARIYGSLFGDGRVVVIDIPDTSRPQEARVVAFIGRQQACLVVRTDSTACEATGEVVE